LTSIVTIVVIAIFFITSSDSGSYVIDMIASGGDPDPPRSHRVFWAVSEGVVAAVLLLTEPKQVKSVDSGSRRWVTAGVLSLGPSDVVVGEVLPVVGRVRAQGLETVNHHHARTVLLDQLADAIDHSVQSMIAEDIAEVVIDHLAAHRARIEEGELLPEPEHLLQWLRDGGQVYGWAFRAGVGVHTLLREDRLTRTGLPDDKADGVAGQATA
jgi:predicted transcriptional regulator